MEETSLHTKAPEKMVEARAEIIFRKAHKGSNEKNW